MQSTKKKPGLIRVSKLERKVAPLIPGFERINTTYRAKDLWKQLSPMRLGPFTITSEIYPNKYFPDGILPGYHLEMVDDHAIQVACAETLEGYWQHSLKVYKHDITGTVKEGEPISVDRLKKSFFIRSAEGLSLSLDNTTPAKLRRAFPRKTHGVPIGSYYDNAIWGWVESRKIYCELYASAVTETEAYKKLKHKHEHGINIELRDPDGRDIGNVTPKKLEKELLRDDAPFGHSFVLCCLLLNISPWEKL